MSDPSGSDVAFDVAFDVVNQLGESPRWDHRTGELVWVDIDTGRLWSAAPGGAARLLLQVDRPVTTVALAPGARYVVALEREVIHFDPVSHERRRLVRLIAPEARFNDGSVDGAGRFWLGSMGTDHGPGRGSLVRLSPDTFDEVLHGVGMSNGVGWSLDNRRMYYIDSLTRRVDVFDYDLASGTASGRRPFVDLSDVVGYPDGLTVDADDRVWVVMWDGGTVRCHDASGAPVQVLTLPVTRPTSCAFGGQDLGTLFITTSSSGLTETARAAQPLAGRILAVEDVGHGVPAIETVVAGDGDRVIQDDSPLA